MITHNDEDYKATKRILLGTESLSKIMREIAEWVADRYSVRVLNAIHSPAGGLLRNPRLQIILEHRSQVTSFRDGFNFNKIKQNDIAKKFATIVGQNAAELDCDGMFVVFSAFAPIANQEADSKLSNADIEKLKQSLDDPELWVISRSFGYVTFMFFTEQQAKYKSLDGTLERYASRYFDILKPFDQFNYLDRKKYIVRFDSKQNFDENYQGNWMYYYR